MVGCAQGNCIRTTSSDSSLDTKSKDQKTVQVYKYDGSLQCGLGKVVSLGEMKSELEDFLIYKMDKKSDGLMRTMNCGSQTGMANVYEISEENLEEAKKLGFEVWSFN